MIRLTPDATKYFVKFCLSNGLPRIEFVSAVNLSIQRYDAFHNVFPGRLHRHHSACNKRCRRRTLQLFVNCVLGLRRRFARVFTKQRRNFCSVRINLFVHGRRKLSAIVSALLVAYCNTGEQNGSERYDNDSMRGPFPKLSFKQTHRYCRATNAMTNDARAARLSGYSFSTSSLQMGLSENEILAECHRRHAPEVHVLSP